MNQVEIILGKLKEMLLRLGFKETVITNAYRSEINYVYKNLYCIPICIEKLGFIMEYAGSYEDAAKYWHDDGDAFPLGMGEEAILAGIEHEVRRELMDQ